MKQLLMFDENETRDISIIPVHNAKSNQLFVYSTSKRQLIVLKVEKQIEDEQQSQLKMGTLLKNNVLCTINNFDHIQGKKYFLEQSSLYFAKRGDLCEVDLITGKVRSFDF